MCVLFKWLKVKEQSLVLVSIIILLTKFSTKRIERRKRSGKKRMNIIRERKKSGMWCVYERNAPVWP